MKDNFLERYDNTLSDTVCKSLIDEFQYQYSIGNTYQATGKVQVIENNDEINKKILNSQDLSLSDIQKKDELLDQQIFYHIDDTFLHHLKLYQDKYNINQYFLNLDIFDPANLKDKNIISFPNEAIPQLFDRSQVILRKFNSEEKDGQHTWGNDYSSTSEHMLYRSVSILLFLNDVDDGGEVEFFHQNIKIKPKKGTLILFPSQFTHTYKINIPTSDMYILRSWVKIN